MNKVWHVALRDIVYQLRKKDFYWATFSVPGLALIITLLAQFVGGGDDQTANVIQTFVIPEARTIGYVDQAQVLTDTTVLADPAFVGFASQAAAEQALRDERIDVVFVIPADYQTTAVITRITTNAGIIGGNDVIDLRVLLSYNAMQQPDLDLAQRLHRPLTLASTQSVATGSASSGSFFSDVGNSLFTLGVALALYGSIFMGASLLMQSVLEEKENRTLEVLLTSIAPRQLLLGKIIGLGSVALLQLLIWGLLASLTLQVYTLPELADALSLQLWVIGLMYFVVGFLFYASLMAGIGAISPSIHELSQLIIVISLPSLVPILVLPAIFNAPNGGLAVALSFVPFTAPSTMMMRLTLTVVPLWQVGLSLVILAASLWLTLAATARLFRASILLLGTKLSPRAVWRALRA